MIYCDDTSPRARLGLLHAPEFQYVLLKLRDRIQHHFPDANKRRAVPRSLASPTSQSKHAHAHVMRDLLKLPRLCL
jgi:hypothetical protein